MRFEHTPGKSDAPTDTPAPPPPPPLPPSPTTVSPTPVAAPPDAPTRRRRNRSWSTPTGGAAESFERPLTDRDWARSKAGSPAPVPVEPVAVADADAQDVAALVIELRADVASLRAELTAERDKADTTLVTGAELAASIDALGTTLGTGLAALLTEHRNLLARDLEGAADRILEELGQRVRASGTLTVDAVEERVRHISAKGLGDLSEQLDLRLDQLGSDVSGLRAVMLEIPDQTQVVDRLDHLADSIGPSRSRDTQRLSPAMAAAVERAVTDAVGRGPDSDALAALTKEITALRRRIALRPDAVPERAGAAEEPDDEAPDDEVPADAPVDDAPDAEPKPRVLSARSPRTPRPARTAKAAGIRIEDEASSGPAKRSARKATPKR